jgi:hypothetical protein
MLLGTEVPNFGRKIHSKNETMENQGLGNRWCNDL